MKADMFKHGCFFLVPMFSHFYFVLFRNILSGTFLLKEVFCNSVTLSMKQSKAGLKTQHFFINGGEL